MARSTRRRHRLRSDLRCSVIDAAFFSLMVGMGETYLSAFALALQVGEVTTGLLAALPMLAGATLQLASPAFIQRIASHQRWVVACATGQALSLLLLPVAIFADRWSIVILYTAATLYWACGLATGPAWNTWIEEIVPLDLRTSFFALRSRFSQGGVLVGFVIGGLVLEWSKSRELLLPAFCGLFVVAAACRLVSTTALAGQSEPSAGRAAHGHVGLREISRQLHNHAGMRLLAYLFAVQVAVQMSGPYFAPYMLNRMHLSYTEYMLLVALGFFGKVLGLPMWGRVAQRAGVGSLLWIGGLGIVPLSGSWMVMFWFPKPMLYLIVLQLAGGIAWGAYELAFFLMFFETIPRHERTSVLTLYNAGNALAMVVGALLGAGWLKWLSETDASYLFLFGLSSLGRLLALGLLMRVPRSEFKAARIALRVLGLPPNSDSSLDRPILSSIPEQSPNEPEATKSPLDR